MTREYAEGLRDHKQTVFKDFQRIIPRLEEAFPEIALDKLAGRIKRFQQLLGDTHKLRVEPISNVLVRISP